MESVMLDVKSIVSSGRWDYDYNQVEYVRFDNQLQALKTKPLQSLCKQPITKGETPLWKGDKYVAENEGILFIRSENLREYGLDLSSKTFIPFDVHERMQRSQIQSGDVLIAIVGATIGQVAVVPDDVNEANFNQAVAIIRPKEGVDPYYLRAILQSNLGQTQIHRLSGGTARPNLDLWETRILRFPIPSRSLQNQIAQVMQEAYRDRQKKLEEAKILLSCSSRVILEKLDLGISELKDEKHFTVSITKMAGGRFDLDLYNTCYTGLIALLQEKFGSNLTPLKSLSQQITSGATPLGSKYFDLGVPFLRVQNLNDTGEINFDDCLFVSEAFAKTLKRAIIQNGDILLVIVGATIGKSAVVKDIEPPLVTNQALARIRILKTVDLLPDFLQVFLSSPVGQIQISALKRPVAQGNLTLTETGQILVPMIPLDQQEKVISRIHAYRSEAKRLQNEAEAVVATAKARVERMILGEEVGDG